MRHPKAIVSLFVSLALASLAVGCEDEGFVPTESMSFSHAPGLGSPPAARNFVAPLNPREEVPAPDLTETKNPTGNAKFRLGGNGDELSYRLIVANIENVTQSHIHCGAAGVAGPVVVFLFGFVPGGVSTDGILAEGTITNADIIARPDSDACPGGVANFNELLAHMRAGTAYVNVHTTQNPAGEIRGQIRTAGPNH